MIWYLTSLLFLSVAGLGLDYRRSDQRLGQRSHKAQ